MNNTGTDYFGYSRQVKAPGEVLSSEFATLAIDGGDQLLLLQNCTVNYQHAVQPVFEAGTPDLYWVTGQPQGSCGITRAVGKEGFLSKFNGGRSCAELRSLNVALNGRGGCVQATAGKGVAMSGCMPQAIGFSFGAGQLQMQESLTLLIANLREA